MFGFLEDSKGNKSSKRLVGTIILINALVMADAVVIIAVFTVIKDGYLIKDILWGLLSSGVLLLGAGILEKLKRKGG